MSLRDRVIFGLILLLLVEVLLSRLLLLTFPTSCCIETSGTVLISSSSPTTNIFGGGRRGEIGGNTHINIRKINLNMSGNTGSSIGDFNEEGINETSTTDVPRKYDKMAKYPNEDNEDVTEVDYGQQPKGNAGPAVPVAADPSVADANAQKMWTCYYRTLNYEGADYTFIYVKRNGRTVNLNGSRIPCSSRSRVQVPAR
ncbi:unnamed protein product [Allacma fusca]|uniref:Uncharacterized protein n=1 Tax=Allacma fusca TaxID=39272 RepID=A0A8J2KG18_9HEXA|nr:unnamed protein product [Allacma fusca]